MKFSENLQKLLPFGYLFLVVLGILKESIFYYQIDINILKYSSLMDILISPIATLTSNLVAFVGVVLFAIVLYAYPAFLAKKRDKKWAQKLSSLKNAESLSEEQIANHFTSFFAVLFACGLFSFFIGIGLGQGKKLAKRINNNTLKYDHVLNYSGGESEVVYLIDVNSVYYFYLTKGSKRIKIAPLGSVKNMELILNKKIQ
ncbi:hypothetical protein [Pedobacter aquatilis]|uniref:hypothetical protein n=1 Tax=Pedobacter aquatilis TaxID=351343 RepID=UPI00292E2FE7|nr:hypothetical protein [Pedobacter aquatilis]